MHARPKELMLEFTSWFERQLESGDLLPKVFSGVNIDGSQYIMFMSELDLDSSEHLDFMRYVLHAENSIAFVFKMRMAAELGTVPPTYEEQHLFYSGQLGSYYSMQLTSKAENTWDEGSQVLRESHTTTPEIFFQEILPQSFKPSAEDAKYERIWDEVRSEVMWRDRMTTTRDMPSSDLFEPVSYSGGDGLSEKNAVKIHAKASVMGVPAEYAYVEKQYGEKGVDWILETQSNLEADDGRSMDCLEIKLRDGSKVALYFDISEFH